MKVSSVLQRDKSKYSLIKKVVVALLLLIYCPKFSFGTKNEVQLDSLNIIHEIDSLLLQFDSLFYENPQQAEVVINTTLQLSKVAEYKAGYTKSVLGTANIMASKGNFKDALDNYNQSIDLAKALNNMMLMFQCYKSRGNLFLTSGLYEDALSSYMTAMFIAEGENYQNEKIRIYNNVGLVYSKQGLYEKAKQYIKKSLSLNPPLGLENSILNNLGIQYVKLADYDSALWCYNQSIVICGKLESDVCEADPLGNIGEIYLFKQEYTKALYFLFKAKRRYESIGAKEPQIPVLSNIGRVYQNMGDYKNSIIYLEKAMKFAKEGNNPILLYKLHYNLAWAYRTAGEIDLSWDNLDDYQKLHDSIVSAESNRRLEKLLAKFEIDRKEKEIELLNKENQLQNAVLATKQSEVERQSQIRNITVISSFCIIIPILILLIVYQQKIKANELLSIRNEEINKQKILKLIQDHEIKAIKAMIEGQEKERTRIASDLHDGIGGTLASIKFDLIRLQKESDGQQRLQQVIKKIDDSCHEIRTITHHLTPIKILNQSFIEMIKYYLDEIAQSNSIKLSFSSYPKNELNQLSDEIKIEIYRIIQELMNNIIKHAQAKHVDVQITKRTGNINLIVEDSGVGFNTSKNYHGIGLHNIVSRVNLLNGDFDIDSSKGRGTIVIIDIPTDTDKKTSKAFYEEQSNPN